MNGAIVAQVVWLIVGVLTAVFCVVALYQGSRAAHTVLGLIAGILLVLAAVNVWP